MCDASETLCFLDVTGFETKVLLILVPKSAPGGARGAPKGVPQGAQGQNPDFFAEKNSWAQSVAPFWSRFWSMLGTHSGSFFCYFCDASKFWKIIRTFGKQAFRLDESSILTGPGSIWCWSDSFKILKKEVRRR